MTARIIAYGAEYESDGIFSHLKLCLATAIHSFKWLKIEVVKGQDNPRI